MKKISSKQLKREVARIAALALIDDIKSIIDETGVTRQQIISEAGEYPAGLSKTLNGVNVPGLDRLFRILHAIGSLAGKQYQITITEINRNDKP